MSDRSRDSDLEADPLEAPTELFGTPLKEIEEEFISVAEMQNRIMPDRHLLRSFGEYQLYGMTLPTAVVGGDFFDFVDLDQLFRLRGRLGVVIADASGHGLSAAMLVRDFNTALYTAITFQAHYAQDTSPLLVEALNRRMFRSSLSSQFIGAFYGELHLDGTLRYINAGHLPPLLFHRRGVERLEIGGPVLGAFEQTPVPYQVGEVSLQEGELLLCYTDGIVETTNPEGEEFGEARLIRTVREARNLKPVRLFERIIERVERFRKSLRPVDDRTLVIIRR